MHLRPSQIPAEVLRVTEGLQKAGFEAWVVGGCVRDLLLGRRPADWDVTTDATPEQIQGLFENTFYTNTFGTVGVVHDSATDESLKVVEVTPYRVEGEYEDARRPKSVIFSHKIDDDLKRRDFTINALAYDPSQARLLDLFGGIKDISEGLVRAVGEPQARLEEDALRILRAVRIAAQLGFAIEPKTLAALSAAAPRLEKISKERIRDEFVRIIESSRPMEALLLCRRLGMLPFVLPELEQGAGIDQNQAHKYDVLEHSLRALQHAADKNWPLEVRLAALLHDIGKPKSRRWSEEKKDWTFHGHEVVGARMAKKILETLKFSRETIEAVVKLVRWHMFFSDPEKITLSAVRRIIVNVGRERISQLIELRVCDRIGTGRPKEQPFRLRKYQAMIDEALRDPISVAMLKIDGKKIMELGEKPGARIGWVLHALLEEVLDDPKKNSAEYLEKRAGELLALSDKELSMLGEEGKERKTLADQEEIKDIHKKHFVD
jgi:tRNA nucleotidyltransferase (CCA-adding enzyme)